MQDLEAGFRGVGRPAPLNRAAIEVPSPRRERLEEAAAEVMGRFGQALSEGRRAEAEAAMVSDAELERILAPGPRQVLGGALRSQNMEALAAALRATDGRSGVTHTWRPGVVRYSPENSGTFRRVYPIMGSAALELREGNALLWTVTVEQIIYVDDVWKIFALSPPPEEG